MTPQQLPILFLGFLLAVSPALGAGVTVTVLDRAGAPLSDAAVFLESPEARAAVRPGREVAIAQVQRQFSPLMTLVSTGTAVSFPNRDTVRHHVYSFSPVKNFELKLYAGTPAHPVVFDRPGIAVLGCNIHDNMAAWVVVVDTPHFGRSDAQGKVALDGVPPGAYRLRAWHLSQPVGAAAADQALSVAAAGAAATVQLKDAKP